jgi:hypothetical protein
MKKQGFLFFVLSAIFFCGCNKQPKVLGQESVDKQDSLQTPFSPIVERELRSFIQLVDNRFGHREHNPKLLYYLRFYKKDEVCFLRLVSDYYYNEEYIKGYYFLDEQLIIYIGSTNSSCDQPFIKEEYLMVYADSIPGYKNVNTIDMEYSLYKRTLRIINADSMEVVSTGYS